MRRCVECTKSLLDSVNTAKRTVENKRRLEDLQNKLDTRDFDRTTHSSAADFKNFDLRLSLMVHDGTLTWRLNKNKVCKIMIIINRKNLNETKYTIQYNINKI